MFVRVISWIVSICQTTKNDPLNQTNGHLTHQNQNCAGVAKKVAVVVNGAAAASVRLINLFIFSLPSY